MLEVNDFTSVRISLASPEQIRSWSYGEVTKPETINYRTLRPEKDGLFCEKIFGPTKDWECYCGKYKRVRYKGIICDKCGVEVARAKVRRERMGHIELASPVSHIWFVKGTPSRIGLLLDKSPRELERVLYFAAYMITEVDEQARAEAISGLETRITEEREQREAAVRDKIADLQADLDERLVALDQQRREQVSALEMRIKEERDQVQDEARQLEAELGPLVGQAAPRDVVWGDRTLVRENEAVKRDTLATIAGERQDRLDAIDVRYREELANIEARIGGEADLAKAQFNEESERIQARLAEELGGLQETIEQHIQELHDLEPLVLLQENKYRELADRYGHTFKAGMGAEAVREVVAQLDLDELANTLRGEIRNSSGSGQRRKKATKRLRVVEAFRKSGNRPEWMILSVLPVLPPELRPMVQLDGGRFATSDLNDLYRRVINRNNRLKRLLELGAPEIIIRNEKRMLQEAVDSLIDNGRRGRAVSGSSNHKLKSLSDMLKGKQGRFRQNLLGKRVDYSGRSVIVVGPNLKLHQCGLPKKMALELFKPFVMRRLVERGFAQNIKSAKRIVERVRPEVWDVLEDVIQDHPVLLNRAPTLHRLGIQAFQPILIEGSAIQIHPLVCAAFGADFDGDQMAVHVPLSQAARDEAKHLMMSSLNLLSPASGEPIVSPSLDMVMGCYYMTVLRPGAKGEGRVFASEEEAQLAYELRNIDLQAQIKVRTENGTDQDGAPVYELQSTSVGRIMFKNILPPDIRHMGENLMNRSALRGVVGECFRRYGMQVTAEVVDSMKRIGFDFATKSGLTIAIGDIVPPPRRDEMLNEADRQVAELGKLYRRGLITDQERYDQVVAIWNKTRDDMIKIGRDALDPYGGVYIMTSSGAKGNPQQLNQMAGFRGLMADPSGRVIETPVRSSFREGLTVLEYFISTHGSRKGLADTAIKTADSGYLTRRLVDVAQDVIVHEHDCGSSGIWIEEQPEGREVVEPLIDRIVGRCAAADLIDPETGEIVVAKDELIEHDAARMLIDHGVKRFNVRSPLACLTRHGVCQLCYGRNMARGGLVQPGEAVGIIAAQSIGEPGTQLTMRTFHTGGVAGTDITSGLPRVEELFEARVPKGQAIIAEIDGVVELQRNEEQRRVKIVSQEVYSDEQQLPEDYELTVNPNDWVEIGTMIAKPRDWTPVEGEEQPRNAIFARMSGNVTVDNGMITVHYEDREEREYPIPAAARLLVENGQRIGAGDPITDGAANPQDILRILGREAVQIYLVNEVQRVYRTQGVTINDKHIEVIVRQLLRKVRVDTAGDTDLLPSELVDRFAYEDINAKVLAEGGEPATAQTVLLGVTKASLSTDSFLAAASFQETTRVLTEAAIQGMTDKLIGLKENVIIGKLIPAGSGVEARRIARERHQPLQLVDDAEYSETAETTPAALLDNDVTDDITFDSDGDGDEDTGNEE